MHLFSKSIAQEPIITFFTQSIKHDRLAHAYLFHGSEGSGKEAFAFELAKVLNCQSAEERPCKQCSACLKIDHLTHPDIQYIFPLSKQTKPEAVTQIIKSKAQNPYSGFDIEGHKNIPIEKMRDLKNEAKYAPFEAKKRFFIISGVEYFSREAANSFLKLLEEPPDNLIIILITQDIHSVLDTIRSRCHSIHFPRLTAEQISALVERYGYNIQDLRPIMRMARYNLKKLFALLERDAQEKKAQVYRFLQCMATNNMLELAEIIDILTQKGDKNYIIEFLEIVIFWLRDALHFTILKDREDFINLDFAEAIVKFAQFSRYPEWQEMIGLVEKAVAHIDQNAHPTLTLTMLALEMNDHLLVSHSPLKEVV